jgi:hypothetical protein
MYIVGNLVSLSSTLSQSLHNH